jgi:hypothetical protein
MYYLSCGLSELRKIYATGMRRFPPRGPGNPNFWPYSKAEDAVRMARFSLQNRPPGYAGYVLVFSFASALEPDLEAFTRRRPGRPELVEIPAAQFDFFNRRVQSPIRVVGAYFGRRFSGDIPQRGPLAGLSVSEQAAQLARYAREDLELVLRKNGSTVYLNYPYWLTIPDAQVNTMATMIQSAWESCFPGLSLPAMEEGMVTLETETETLKQEARAMLERITDGPPQNDYTIYNLLNRIGDLLQAGNRLEEACAYWYVVHRSGSPDGISALENLRETAGQLGQDREVFRNNQTPAELLRKFLE